jgi:hypothetical protein
VPLGTCWGTHWECEEPLGNVVETKKTPKKLGPPMSMFEPSHWLHEICISKTICHNFSLGLMKKHGSTSVYYGTWIRRIGLFKTTLLG